MILHGSNLSGSGASDKPGAVHKEAILAALNDAGGQAYLVKMAHENPVAFLALLGRILPMQVAGDPERPLATVQEVKWIIVDPKEQQGL